jgi:hypothetical protein
VAGHPVTSGCDGDVAAGSPHPASTGAVPMTVFPHVAGPSDVPFVARGRRRRTAVPGLRRRESGACREGQAAQHNACGDSLEVLAKRFHSACISASQPGETHLNRSFISASGAVEAHRDPQVTDLRPLARAIARMHHDPMNLSRTAFLGATGAVALSTQLVRPADAAVVAPNPTQGLPYNDFIARARAPFAHRQMFASTRPNGNVFVFMRNSLNGYQFGWGEGPHTLHAVAVYNGLGVAQGVGDEGWSRYRLRDVLSHDGLTVSSTGTGNPWLHSPAGLAVDQTSQASPFNQDFSIETLVKRGCEFFVCDTAMITLSQAIVRAGAASNADAVHADLRGLLAPGATLVPAGVAAMDALQAEHFTFFDANV